MARARERREYIRSQDVSVFFVPPPMLRGDQPMLLMPVHAGLQQIPVTFLGPFLPHQATMHQMRQ